MNGRVLIVAGSDSGGGAGIQADIKTVTALRGYAMTAITALTAQDTVGVQGVLPVPPEFVAQQMRVVLGDLGADAIKIGMVQSAATIDAVADVIEGLAPGLPVVLDPVMVAKGGARLLDEEALATLTRRLALLATVVTPNLAEAAILCGGGTIASLEDQRAAALMLRTIGASAALVKGGHGAGPEVYDVLATADGIEVFTSPRIATLNTHGTGCTLASAIAAGLAQGLGLHAAIVRARAFVQGAILAAPGFGSGRGPLNHAFAIPPFEPA